MVRLRIYLMITASCGAGILMLGWLGLQILPEPFPAVAEASYPVLVTPLPGGLPAPVERFYNTVYGGEIPVVESAILQGRAILKPFLNIALPTRFVFVHQAGQNYRHYFEATLFGIPIFRLNEGYLDQISFFESPMANISDDACSNQAANLTLWAEGIWFPSVWLTDPRVHWEPVDKFSALLIVPFEAGEESFLVRFDAQTGLIEMMEAMRYRDVCKDQPKTLWILNGEVEHLALQQKSATGGSVMWLDQGSPWADFAVEEVILNADVSLYIRDRGN